MLERGWPSTNLNSGFCSQNGHDESKYVHEDNKFKQTKPSQTKKTRNSEFEFRPLSYFVVFGFICTNLFNLFMCGSVVEGVAQKTGLWVLHLLRATQNPEVRIRILNSELSVFVLPCFLERQGMHRIRNSEFRVRVLISEFCVSFGGGDKKCSQNPDSPAPSAPKQQNSVQTSNSPSWLHWFTLVQSVKFR